MATTKIKITFGEIFSTRDSSTWGTHKWTFDAKVDGTQVGNPATQYNISAGTRASLPAEFTHELDVTAKKPGETVVATFKVIDKMASGDVDYGTVTATYNHPFDTEVTRYFLAPSVAVGGSSFNHYRISIKMEVIATTEDAAPPAAAPVGKTGTGTTTNTVSGNAPTLRVEICPVVPVLRPEQMPPRPAMAGKVKIGKDTEHAKPLPLSGSPALNALANPSLIPILSPTDPDMATKAAKIAVTYMRPHDADISKFTWVVKTGSVKLHGTTKGVNSVLAYGTAEDANPAEIELRDKDEKGPILAVFRAWVGKVKHIPLRSTIIIGDGAGAVPRQTADDVKRFIDLANVLMYQSGLLFVPDPKTTAWDGAVASAHAGIYTINTKDNTMTVGVERDNPPHPVRLNFNPGVMHLCFIKSLKGSAAGVATDRPGLVGQNVTLSGTPSTSWFPPSGVAPDAAAGTVTMLTFDASKARTTQGDIDYVKERKKVDPTFTAADFNKLYGCIMPDYTDPSDADWPQTIAHEVGHVMGLRHRGNPGVNIQAGKIGGNDNVNGAGGWGHPFEENVMSYGYTLSQDFDLIQTRHIRAHASVVTPPAPPTPPPPTPPTPPPPSTKTALQELQALLGVPETDVWDDATESAAKNNMVKYGSTGPLVEWVQKRLTAKGSECGPIDGIDGSKTTAGVKDYQGKHPPLSVDGIAGPRTMQSLAEA